MIIYQFYFYKEPLWLLIIKGKVTGAQPTDEGGVLPKGSPVDCPTTARYAPKGLGWLPAREPPPV